LAKTYLSHWRIWLVISITILGIGIVSMQGRIPQDPAYHDFADQRIYFHIPNFWNVVSNLFFLAAAVAGFHTLCSGECPGLLPTLRMAYKVFFLGSGLVAAGSAFYHLSPTNWTLFWDRLAMAIAFMAFLSIILGEHIEPQSGRLALLPLLAIGLLSVLVWIRTEAMGHGDLRFYILVQFLPFILIPLIVLLFPSRLTKVYFVWGLLFSFGIGKLFESMDAPIYRALHLSGHTLKHLMAALGVSFVALGLRKRTPDSPRESD
jgi:hypothetical protein